MKRATFKAFAKINLTLDVLGRRPDGYHDIKMVMQTVSLYDTVAVELTDESKAISVETNLSFLPTGPDNLAYRAAELFFKETGLESGVKISLRKHIPVGAGLAGGSSDCAVVLKALNKLCAAGLSMRKLCSMGVKLGADVPYCLLGGTRLAEGIGERLSPLPRMPRCHILLVKPSFSISTKTVYEKIDSFTDYRRPDTDAVIAALHSGDLSALAKGMGNVLEEVSLADYPVLASLKRQLCSLGAIAAQMSGSGPTVFGIFTNAEAAADAKKKLQENYRTVYLCSPV